MSKVRSTAWATDGSFSPAQFEPQEAVCLGQLLVKQQGRGIVEARFPMPRRPSVHKVRQFWDEG